VVGRREEVATGGAGPVGCCIRLANRVAYRGGGCVLWDQGAASKERCERNQFHSYPHDFATRRESILVVMATRRSSTLMEGNKGEMTKVNETYYLGAYWGVRQEAVEACATRLSGYLRSIAQCDKLFAEWFLQGKTRRAAAKRRLEVDPETLAAYLAQDVRRASAGHSATPELGFQLGLWTGGQGNSDSASLMISCGCYSPAVGVNACTLQLPVDAAATHRLNTVTSLTSLMGCAVAAWDPDWGLVSSIEYDNSMPEQEGNAPRPGWLMYLADRLGSIPSLPNQVQVTKLGEVGTLITLTTNTLSAQDHSQIQTGIALAAILDEGGFRNQVRLRQLGTHT
jgi:hypothetical protein